MKQKMLRKLILVLFIIVAILGLSNIKSIREFNYLVNYAVWYMWWPLIMVISLFSIRFWCMVCPLRTITDVYSKYSLGLRIPKWIEKYNTLFMVFLFMILHAVVVTLNVSRLPITTAIYLLVLLQYSALMAILFKRKSFCSVFCPLGGVMNIFSTVGLIKLGPANKNYCLSCTNKICGESCPVGLSPQKLPNESCVFCTECIEGCCKNNISFYKENPLKNRIGMMGNGEAFAIVILFGIALSEFRERLEEMAVPGGDWNLLLGKIIEFIPNKLNQLAANPYASKLLFIAWEYLIFPLAFVLILAVIFRIVFYKKSFVFHLNNLASSMVPFVFSIFLVVLINYPLTLFYSGPALVRKVLLAVLLLFGFVTMLYIFFRNLLLNS